MTDPFNLRRFVEAQDAVLPAVLAELRAGAKRSHWMWFVFPQIAGLGHSPTARHYAIGSRAEAAAYLRHDVLGHRLLACTDLVLDLRDRSLHDIFGSPDDAKFRSCMTLFDAIAPQQTPFRQALVRYCGGTPDPRTLELLGG